MGASEHIKNAMEEKRTTGVELSRALGIPLQTLYNRLCRNTMSFANAELIADALGCDVRLIDRDTGSIY